MPAWLTWASVASLALGIGCALWMAAEMRRNPPKMPVMAAVWPLCALFGGPLVVWFQRRRAKRMQGHGHGHEHGHGEESGSPSASSVSTGALHCGAGCTLGDLVAEGSAALFPAILPVFGLGWLFEDRIFAVWVYDFVWAFGLGVIFQYFAIAPMRGLGLRAGLLAAVKADAASLVAWQLGMYGVMAAAQFAVFPALIGRPAEADEAPFWFAMQIAMGAGFLTAWPVNRALIRAGVKEAM